MEDNIQVARSEGGTCFKCERAIRRNEKVIRFTFNVRIPLVGKHAMSEEAHILCAREFSELLEKRVHEAETR